MSHVQTTHCRNRLQTVAVRTTCHLVNELRKREENVHNMLFIQEMNSIRNSQVIGYFLDCLINQSIPMMYINIDGTITPDKQDALAYDRH